MSRWLLVLLIGVAFYVGIVVVRSLVTTMKTPTQATGTTASTGTTTSPGNTTSTGPTTSTGNTGQHSSTSSVVAKVKVHQTKDSRGPVIMFDLQFNTPQMPNLAKEPTFEVLDASGTAIYNGRFEFG